jgi:hypothetical protein
LQAVLRAVSARLARAEVPWMLGGSSARALEGASPRPRDLDIEVAAEHAARAARALGCSLGADADRGWSSVRAIRTLRGVEIDLSAGIVVTGLGWRLDPDQALSAEWSRTVVVGGDPVVLVPPEEALVRALVAGDWSRLSKLVAAGGPTRRPAYMVRRLAAARAVR